MKPKTRTLYLIVNQANPRRFYHYVGHSKKEATEFRDRFFPKAKIVKAEVQGE